MDYLFTNENISASVNELSDYYKKIKLDRVTSIQNTLALEEILLQYREEFGEDATYTFEISRKFGIHYASIGIKGEAFNPISVSDDENEQYAQHLLTVMGVAPTYSYRKGTNRIDIRTERHKLSSISVLLLALVSSIVLGIINKLFVPANIVGVLVGPVVFFTIIVATINVGDLSSLKKFGKTVLRNLFFFSSVIFLLSSVIPFAIVGIDKGGASTSPLRIIRDTVLSIIPDNIVTPFSNNSILQLMFWGIFIGLSLIALEKQSTGIAEGLISLKDVFTHRNIRVGKLCNCSSC